MTTNRNGVRVDKFGRFTSSNNCRGGNLRNSMPYPHSALLTKLVLSSDGSAVDVNNVRIKKVVCNDQSEAMDAVNIQYLQDFVAQSHNDYMESIREDVLTYMQDAFLKERQSAEEYMHDTLIKETEEFFKRKTDERVPASISVPNPNEIPIGNVKESKLKENQV